MKYQILFLVASVSAFAALIPAPPWSGRSPTNAAEIAQYISNVLPHLPEATRKEIDQARQHHAGNADILFIIYAARVEDKEKQQFGYSPSAKRWDLSLVSAYAGSNTLSGVIGQYTFLDKVWNRIHDPQDSLDGLSIYAPVLSLPGVPRELYDRAYDMDWSNDTLRAKGIFELLTATNNPDGFTVGNAHYWIGHTDYVKLRHYDAALNHFLVVHTFPACLVFTDCAYREAAQIYAMRGKMDTALALYSIQIPSVDYAKNEIKKAGMTFMTAMQQNDVTNAVRQILRAEDALRYDSQYGAGLPQSWRADLLRRTTETNLVQITNYLIRETVPEEYQLACIRKAVEGPDKADSDPRLLDMLLHDWPSYEEAALLYPIILTNRPMSNNVFEQKRTTLRTKLNQVDCSSSPEVPR